VLTEADGLPLVVKTTPANTHDNRVALQLVGAMPPIQGPRGRPRSKPKVLQGDAAYGCARLILLVKALGIKPLLKPLRQSHPHGSGLGKTRYVVERTLSWFGNFRRLKLCYEKCGAHFQAFHELAAAILCSNRLTTLNSRF
jgi:transposase